MPILMDSGALALQRLSQHAEVSRHQESTAACAARFKPPVLLSSYLN